MTQGFPPEADDYLHTWRELFESLAQWDGGRLLTMTAYWEDLLVRGVSESDRTVNPLFHEMPYYWIAFELVPLAERDVRSPVWRKVYALLGEATRPLLEKEPWLVNGGCSGVDWDVLREEIFETFASHGYPRAFDAAWSPHWIHREVR